MSTSPENTPPRERRNAVATASILATNVLGLLALPFVFAGGLSIEVILLIAHSPALEVGPFFEVVSLATYVVGASASVAIGAVGSVRALDEWQRSRVHHERHRQRDDDDDDSAGVVETPNRDHDELSDDARR